MWGQVYGLASISIKIHVLYEAPYQIQRFQDTSIIAVFMNSHRLIIGSFCQKMIRSSRNRKQPMGIFPLRLASAKRASTKTFERMKALPLHHTGGVRHQEHPLSCSVLIERRESWSSQMDSEDGVFKARRAITQYQFGKNTLISKLAGKFRIKLEFLGY